VTLQGSCRPWRRAGVPRPPQRLGYLIARRERPANKVDGHAELVVLRVAFDRCYEFFDAGLGFIIEFIFAGLVADDPGYLDDLGRYLCLALELLGRGVDPPPPWYSQRVPMRG